MTHEMMMIVVKWNDMLTGVRWNDVPGWRGDVQGGASRPPDGRESS